MSPARPFRKDTYCTTSGDQALDPILSVGAKAWSHDHFLSSEVIVDLVAELAFDAIDKWKLQQIFDAYDLAIREWMACCAAEQEALPEQWANIELSIRLRLTRKDAGVILA